MIAPLLRFDDSLVSRSLSLSLALCVLESDFHQDAYNTYHLLNYMVQSQFYGPAMLTKLHSFVIVVSAQAISLILFIDQCENHKLRSNISNESIFKICFVFAYFFPLSFSLSVYLSEKCTT